MTDDEDAAGRATAARELAWQAVRALVTFGFGAVAALAFRSEIVTGAATAAGSAVIAAVPALAAYAFGVARTLRHHRERRALLTRLKDLSPETGA